MRHGLAARALAFIALLLPCMAEGREARPDLTRVEQAIVSGTNDFRRDNGRRVVATQAKLEAAAEEFAQFMARTGKYSHEADGRKPSERVVAHGYRYCRVSENISYQYSSEGFESRELAARLLDGWKKSPGHRANMLDAAVVHTAVAVARSPKTGYFYAVQLFGSPRSGGGGC